MQVVIVLPTGVTAFEALGPYGVFNRMSDTTIRLIGERPGRVPCHGSRMPLLAEASYVTADPRGIADVLIVPGGMGVHGLAENDAVLDWLCAAHASASWTIGVSTGSVLLSAAGLLDGQDATTHWLATDLLEDQGAHAVPERMVWSERIVTATGAVGGLEASLFVVDNMRGRAEADWIRSQLDDDLAGKLTGPGPASSSVLAGLAGVDDVDGETTPFALADIGGVSGRGNRRSPWTRRSGRIETVDKTQL